MKKIKHLILISFCIVMICSCSRNHSEKKTVDFVERQIDSLRIIYNIPAISYGVIRNDTIIVQKAIGYRDIESKDKVQLNDLFHIGSNTKAFTSFIAAKLVQDKLISWDTKFFDLFPELMEGSQQAYFEVSLKELLSHKARLIKFQSQSELYPIVDYEKAIDGNLSIAEKRYYFVKQVLKYDPIPICEHSDDRYSNAGYIAAALMLEKATAMTWEQLISEMSAELDLNIQISWPDDINPNEPKGHINPKEWMLDIDQDLIPLPFALKKYHYFNQYILLCSPSGNLSIRLNDFIDYLSLNIEGLNGKDNYLKSEQYQDLFYTYTDYSNGWMNEDYYIPCFHHKGSAGTFNSIAIIEPDKKIGIVVMMNVANGEAINKIAELLIKTYTK